MRSGYLSIQIKEIFRTWLVAGFVPAFAILFAVVPSGIAHAQTRDYRYSDINSSITVNPDSTITVAETQTYQFQGVYHLGWRSIPTTSIGSISDISVTDAQTGQSLTYSSSRLEKDQSSSWGYFTAFVDNGATDIEWYYDLGGAASSTHTWILKYTVQGSLGFYADHDEVYWNLFTDYSVPVDRVEATVHLPMADTQPQASFYGSFSSWTPAKGAYGLIEHPSREISLASLLRPDLVRLL